MTHLTKSAIILWRYSGMDTLDIAEALKLPESEVYNVLARHREKQRRRNAA